MKSPTLLLVLAVTSALGQGSFQNLDFESAAIDQGSGPAFVAVSDALPGWAAYDGTNQVTQVRFNDACIGSTCADLVGTNGVAVFGYIPIEGGFSLLLQGGQSGSGGNLYQTDASIRQTGLVPASAQSVLFKAHPDPAGTLSLSVAGIDIPFLALSNGANYTVFCGGIFAFLCGDTRSH